MTTKFSLNRFQSAALVASLALAFAGGCSNSPPSGGTTGGTSAASSSGGTTGHATSTGGSSTGGSSTGGSTGSSGAAELTISPNTQGFGSVADGASSTPQTFTIKNSGTGVSGTVSVTVTGNNAADFQPSANTCTGTLAANATCTVTITFSPSTVGNESATVTATATPGGSAAASLTGTGTAAGGLAVSPTTFSFGTVTAGQASTAQTFTFTNNGASATGTPAVTLFGGDSTQFQTSADTCSGTAVTAGGSCTISVTFNPTSSGPFASSVQFTASPGGTISAAISGTGVSAAHITSSPPAGAFGNQVDGNPSSPITFTITNQGGVATAALTDAVSGTNATDFAITTDGCTGQVLNANGTCQIQVVFTATVAGAESAVLTVTDSATDAATVNLTGTGGASSGLAFSPGGPFSFGNVVQSATSAPQTLTVQNAAGSATTGTLRVSFGGSNPGDFTIVTNTDGCTGATLGAGQSCSLEVQFTPSTTGSESASITVAGSPGGTAVGSLTGTGVAPAVLGASPPSIDFGSVVQGTTTTSQNITVSNSGGIATGVPTVGVGGANATDFTLTNGCTAALAAGTGNCTIGVTFKPSTTTTESATVTINATPGGSSQVTLSGTGISPSALAFNTGSPTAFHANTEAGSIDQSAAAIPTTTDFTIINNGAQTTGPITFGVGTGAFAGDFTVSSGATNGCVSGTTALTSGQTCTIHVSYLPLKADLAGQNGAVFMQQNLVITPTNGSALTAALSGWGANPFGYNSKIDSVTGYTLQQAFNTGSGVPQSLTFYFFNNVQAVGDPLQTAGTPAGSVTVSGSATLTGDTTDFMASSETCVTSPVHLGDYCSVTVTFDPVSVQSSYTAALTATANVGGSSIQTDTFNLSGTVATNTTVPVCTATGSGSCSGANTVSYDFSNGGANPTTVGSVTESGGTIDGNPGLALPAISLDCSATGGCGLMQTTISGGNAGDFYVVSNGIAGQTSANSYPITVAFIPSATGTRTTTLTVQNTTTGYSTVITLTGTGATAGTLGVTDTGALHATPGQFGTQYVGTTTPAAPGEQFTITNTGGQRVTISNIAFQTGTNFTLSEPTGTGSTPCKTANGFVTLAPAATCNVLVQFTPPLATSPSALGTAVSDALVVSGGTAPASIALTGTPTSPISISPGNVCITATIGEATPPATLFTVTNNGATTIVPPLAAVFSEGQGSLLSIVGNTCTGTLTAAGTCQISVAIDTAAAGQESVQLAVQEGSTGIYAATGDINATGATCGTTIITGQVNAAAALSISPSSADFGSTTDGTGGTTDSFTVTNIGGVDTPFGFSVTPPAGYTYSSGLCGFFPILGPTDSCTFSLTFDPTAGGTAAGNATVTFGSGAGAVSQTVAVTGFGVVAANNVTVSPSTWNAGTVVQGATPPTQTFSLFNGTGAAVSLVNSLPAPFAIVPGGTTCTGTLNNGLGCTMEVEFAPTGSTPAGTVAGSLLLESGATYVALSGNVITPVSLSVKSPTTTSTSPSDFGTVAVGTSSSATTVTVVNSGNVAAGVTTDTMGGAEPGDFVIGADSCHGSGVPAGGQCTINVTFQPSQVVSDETATLSIALSGQTTMLVYFQGSGANAATLAMVPTAAQAFASAVVQGDDYHADESGAEIAFTVTNNGGVSTAPLSTSLNTLSDIYVVDRTTSSCFTSNYTTNGLPGGASCTFMVDMKSAATSATGAHAAVGFEVTAGALHTGTVSVSGSVSPYLTVSVTGSGSGTGSAASPYDYGTVTVGSTGAAATYTFANNSHEYSTGLIESALSNEGNYSVVSDSCTGKSLAGQGTCAISVLFNPQSASAATSTLTATDDGAGGESATANMKGNP